MWRIKAALGVTGAGLLVFAVTLANDARNFVDGSLQTEGTVLRVERLIGPRNESVAGMRYNYVIWFPTSYGKTVAIQRKISDAQSYFRPGDLIPIRYNPASPKQSARIATVVNIWARPLLFGTAGAACLVFAAGSKLRRKRVEFRPS